MKTNFKTKLYDLLKIDSRLWDEEKKELNETLLKDLIDKLDEKLIELLLSDKETNKKFFVKIKDVLVLKQNELKFFIDENKLDNSYTQYQNKIGLKVGNKLLSERDEVVLDWPFKDCVLEGGMTKEDQKRNEIFFNEILAEDEIDRLFDSKVLVNWKRYTAKGEEKNKEIKRDKDGTIRENLIIKGNNLLVLHSLKKQFTRKVKLIYIDPPYNREIDKFYNDNFKHSSWLTFMKNRIKAAVHMLRDDGVIFVQCDDSEYPYLKVLMDEIDDLKYELTYYVQVRYAQKTLAENSNYQKLIEHVLCYSKQNFKPIKSKVDYSIEKFCWNIIELKKGEIIELGGKEVEIFKPGEYKIEKVSPNPKALKEVWATGTLLRTTAKFFRDYLMDRKEIDGIGILYKVIGVGGDGLGYRYFTGPQRAHATKGKYYSGIPLKLIEAVSNGNATKELVINNFYDMSDAFGNCRHEGGVELRSGKKPEIWLKTLLDIGSKEGDIVMDFFVGTGGTCAVSHKTNRQYIGVEQLYYGENDSVVRLKNVISGDQSGISKSVNWQGGGNFVYVELAKWNEEAKEKILKAKSLTELEKLFDELYERYFLNYNIKTKEFKEKILKEEGFKNLSLDKQKNLFVEMLDMNQMYVNFSERADKKYNLSEKDIKLSEEFYLAK